MARANDSPLSSSHVDGGYGSAPRLPFTGFLVWGLLTFWVYPAIRLAIAWREHTTERWHEFRSILAQGSPNEQRLSDLQARGFSPGVAAPYAAAAAFALSGIMVAGWFVRWMVLGATLDYREIMIAVGLSALLFYVAMIGVRSSVGGSSCRRCPSALADLSSGRSG